MQRRLWLLILALVALACGGTAESARPAPAPAPPPSAAPTPKPEAAPAHGHGPGQHADHPHPAHTHDGSPHRFEDAARWSKVFDDPERDAWQRPDDVVRELGLSADDVVADLGAGTGYFTLRLARAVPKGRVVAIDLEQSMLDWIGKRAEQQGVSNVETRLATEGDPRLPTGVDLVLIVDTYHHLTDRVAYFQRVREPLDDDGRVVIVDFKMGKLPVGPPDNHKIPRHAIVREMKDAGYALCREWDGLPYQHTLFFGERC